MSDTIDRLTGTLGELVKKAKEVGSQAIGTVDPDGTVRGVYERGAERTKAYARIAKLNLELNRESEELRRVYTEIGRLYFEQAREKAEGFFAPLFAQAETSAAKLRSILAKYQEVELLLKIGEYQKGADKETDEAIDKIDSVNNFLKQGLRETNTYDETIRMLSEAVS